MFDNKGDLIKTLAYLLLVIGVIGVLIAAFAVGSATGRYGVFNFLAFLGVLVGGGLSVYISSLYLYVFGNIEEKTDDLRKEIKELKMALAKKGIIETMPAKAPSKQESPTASTEVRETPP